MCFVCEFRGPLLLDSRVLKPKKPTAASSQIGKIRIYIKILAVIKAHALGKLLENKS